MPLPILPQLPIELQILFSFKLVFKCSFIENDKIIFQELFYCIENITINVCNIWHQSEFYKILNEISNNCYPHTSAIDWRPFINDARQNNEIFRTPPPLCHKSLSGSVTKRQIP